MKQVIHLLAIDPQNDFCDVPQSYLSANPTWGDVAPALAVPGAHQDMIRLSALVEQAGDGLDAIIVTEDTHEEYDIAHPAFWRRADGAPAVGFTPITAAEVRAGQFLPVVDSALPRTLAYLDELEARGRYTLMVWPKHCIDGSWGQQVHAEFQKACSGWSAATNRKVLTVAKGMNPWTEHYSAIQAEVPDAEDSQTQLNVELIATLDQADIILIGGEASSHCVRATTEHLVANLPSGRLERVILLTDCMSPVDGFAAQQAEFFADMQRRGVRLSTTAQVLPILQANASL